MSVCVSKGTACWKGQCCTCTDNLSNFTMGCVGGVEQEERAAQGFSVCKWHLVLLCGCDVSLNMAACHCLLKSNCAFGNTTPPHYYSCQHNRVVGCCFCCVLVHVTGHASDYAGHLCRMVLQRACHAGLFLACKCLTTAAKQFTCLAVGWLCGADNIYT